MPRAFTEAMEELLEICEAKKAPKVVASSVAALIAQDERKLFCWMGDPPHAIGRPADSPAGLYASDFLEKLVIAARALDWEKVVVLVHEAMSSPLPIVITAEMVEAGIDALVPYCAELGSPEDYVRDIYRSMVAAKFGRTSRA